MSLNKYFQLIKISWQDVWIYKGNFILWRLRNVLVLLGSYLFWLAVYQDNLTLGAYSKSQMLTYVFLAAVIESVVLSSRVIGLGGIIRSGDLVNILIRPIKNYYWWFARDLADKAQNLFFALAEIALLIFILRPPLSLSVSLSTSVLFSFSILLSFLLFYQINYLLGLLGFWLPDVWAPRFLFMAVLNFTAGRLFPLDILPHLVQKIINFTPFPYLVYLPAQILLRSPSLTVVLPQLALALLWTIFFFFLIRFIWKKQLPNYSAEGH